MPEIDLPDHRPRAPEFAGEFAWINTDRPLFLHEELKGRVVVLDFWTYCCINCMHVLPDLEYIEKKYADDPVVVIGVHSAKFANEGDDKNIRTACHRYEIEHPVIVDENHRIWSEYAVRAWPTLTVIDPEGGIIGSLPGEGNRNILDAVIAALLDEGSRKGTLASGPPEVKRKSRVPAASGLAFPGKVLADPSGKWLFITDTNHHRIIISDPDGNVKMIAGSGAKGQQDGSFHEAEFDQPQGLAFDSRTNLLYVADTENHLLRELNLNSHTVKTIAGTGIQVYDRNGGKHGTEQGLNSPWDLALKDDTLYIAMAGPHQLWRHDLKSGITEAWLGSGREDIIDGNGLTSAALAQPSGLALHGDLLYFADSEVSAVRRANLKTRDAETLVGTGLFDFGDRVGSFRRTLFQHPLGVAVHGADVLVADTYNHKIKRLNLRDKSSSEVIGSGKTDPASEASGELSLYEPGGISVNGDLLFIADTNHDRIVRVDLNSGKWRELQLRGLRARESLQTDTDKLPLHTISYHPESGVELRLDAKLPEGLHLNREAPLGCLIMPISSSMIPIEETLKEISLPALVQISAEMILTNEDYLISLFFAYCTSENAGLCVPVTLTWKVEFFVTADVDARAELTAEVQSIRNE